MTINPLLCSPSPRDIPEVLSAWKDLPVHKFLVKYHDEKSAYKILREFFLDHKEYTHMVICPDDLIATADKFKDLKFDVEYLGYPVIAGICNLSWQQMNTYSCCWKVSGFKFFTDEDLKGDIIKQVEHEAFACSWMRRDVVEQIELNGMNEGHHFDWAFSLECHKRGIPIYVDTSAKMLHLRNRLGNGLLENSGVGIKEPTTIYERI